MRLHDYQCSKCKRLFDIPWKRCPTCGNRTLIRRIGKKAMDMAAQREEALDYKAAIEIWEELGEIKEAARVRRLKAKQGAVKVAQKVVHGDEVSKTEIKDSVLNRSNVRGGSSKMQELKELTAMKKEGLIDDDEFKQMKKEILGK